MDRDTVRLLLIIIGVFLLAGIYIWGRFKDPVIRYFSERKELNENHPESFEQPYAEFDNYTNSSDGSGRKEPQLSSLDYADDDDLDEFLTQNNVGFSDLRTDLTSEGPEAAPFLIQISVVAGPGRFFDGSDLKQALLDTDLLYGDMGIFHRYDRTFKQALFSVASLVEPGTFPIDEMESFECPGIVLFFQTARVSNPLEVYDDLVETSKDLATRLKGIQWDETRQPLSASRVAHMRHLLKHAAAD